MHAVIVKRNPIDKFLILYPSKFKLFFFILVLNFEHSSWIVTGQEYNKWPKGKPFWWINMFFEKASLTVNIEFNKLSPDLIAITHHLRDIITNTFHNLSVIRWDPNSRFHHFSSIPVIQI